jgi:hypothetical protein
MEALRSIIGAALFGGGMFFIRQSTEAAEASAPYYFLGGFLMMVIGAFMVEGFRQLGLAFLLLYLAIGFAVGGFVGFVYNSATMGLAAGFGAAIVGGLVIEVVRRQLKAPRRTETRREN